jgi:hypothetical protein
MNKIIALWVHPRSLSTVMERVMIERGDFKIFHEPFAYLYYLHDKKGDVPYMKVDPKHPTSYEDTKKWILDTAEKTPVSFKDMAYYVSDYIFDDDAFLNRMINTFMIREPIKTILSYYKVDSEVDRDEIGYEYLFKLFRKVADLNDNKAPIVITAEDLEDDPEGTVEAYCEAVGIDFKPESLNWEASEPDEWKGWDEWHKDAIASTGIKKDMEKFDITIDEKPFLRSYYEYHLPFYEGMMKHRLKPKK